MPLHSNTIPLCSFNYVGDFDVATFKYDTTERIGKNRIRLFYKYKTKEISKLNNILVYGQENIMNKCNNQYMYREQNPIDKNIDQYMYIKERSIDKNSNKYIYNSGKILNKKYSKFTYIKEKIINKNSEKTMYSQFRTMNKSIGCLLRKNIINLTEILNCVYVKRQYISFNKNTKKNLLKEYKKINIIINKNLNINSRIISKQNNKELFNHIMLISKNYSKQFKILDLRILNIFSNKELNIKDNRKSYIKTNLELKNSIIKSFNKYNIKRLKINIKQLNINKNITLARCSDSCIFRVNNMFVNKQSIQNIDHNFNIYYFYKNKKLRLFKNKFRFLWVLNNKNCVKNNKKRMMYRAKCIKLCKNNYSKFLIKCSNISINLSNLKKLFYRINVKPMYIYDNELYLWRNVIKYIYKNKDMNYIYRYNIKPMYYRNILDFVQRYNIVSSFKIKEKTLNCFDSINTYKIIEKSLLDGNILDLYKKRNMFLKGNLIKSLYKFNSRYIRIFKRWWWLKSTKPIDRIIIPNKDYSYSKEQLNNENYEYLRFSSNFPIPYGEKWGIDYSVPSYEVSIEIMLDMVNNLVMIWQHNVQALLSCTGKEGVQFLMEILYEWYIMDNSKPNEDYYRAYRWIRWEAEKVYFLKTNNGLQSIGILIDNLIDYMKYHHFDIVPLWRNPKAMDIERNFNRNATNGDLINKVDKIKGKRNYYIETQNFQRKNLLGGK